MNIILKDLLGQEEESVVVTQDNNIFQIVLLSMPWKKKNLN